MTTSFVCDAAADVGFGFVGRCRSASGSRTRLRWRRRASGPRSAPIAPVIAEYMSRAGAGDDARGEGRGVELVLGVQDQRGVHRPHPRARCGGLPCSRCRKCPPIESSSVSTSMRLPLWLKWYQYSSIEPSEAISRSAMSRAPGSVVVVLLRQHAAERRARRCASRPSGAPPAGSCSSTALHALRAGRAATCSLRLVAVELGARSAACRAPAGRRSPRTRRRRRCRGCRSRGSAGRCRCGRRCTARCCRRRRRTARPISSA